MYATIIIGVIAVLLSYFNQNSYNNKLLKCSFVLITLFLALSYDWGPDVPTYDQEFKYISLQSFSITDFSAWNEIRRNGEFGWTFLIILFSKFSFYFFRFVLFSVENYIIYILVRDFVDKKWQWLSAFIYVFNASEFMVISSPMMRQWLAMCLIVGAFLLYKKQSYKAAIALICIAPLIHSSAILCIAIIPLLFINLEFSFLQKGVILSFVTLFILFGVELVSPFLLLLMSGNLDFYELYLGNVNSGGTGIANLIKIFVYVTMFLTMDKLNNNSKTILTIAFVSILFIPLFSVSQLIVRVSFYFSIFSIAAIPMYYSQSSIAKPIKFGMLLFLLTLYIYGFWAHFTGPVYYDTMYEYHTILGCK